LIATALTLRTPESQRSRAHRTPHVRDVLGHCPFAPQERPFDCQMRHATNVCCDGDASAGSRGHDRGAKLAHVLTSI
jgi:hypothetical protein